MITGNFSKAEERIQQYLKVSEKQGFDFNDAPGLLLFAQLHNLKNSIEQFEMNHQKAMAIFDLWLHSDAP